MLTSTQYKSLLAPAIAVSGDIRMPCGMPPRTVEEAGQTNSIARQLLEELSSQWCLKFHRKHYRRYKQGEHNKVKCACCGHKFIRRLRCRPLV